MPDMMVIAVLVLVGCMIAARTESEKGLRYLSPEDKRRLAESLAPMKAHQLIPPVALLVIFLLLQYRGDCVSSAWGWALLVIASISQAATTLLMRRKLRALALPLQYIRRVLIAGWITFAGFAVLVALFLVDTV